MAVRLLVSGGTRSAGVFVDNLASEDIPTLFRRLSARRSIVMRQVCKSQQIYIHQRILVNSLHQSQ